MKKILISCMLVFAMLFGAGVATSQAQDFGRSIVNGLGFGIGLNIAQRNVGLVGVNGFGVRRFGVGGLLFPNLALRNQLIIQNQIQLQRQLQFQAAVRREQLRQAAIRNQIRQELQLQELRQLRQQQLRQRQLNK